MVAGDEIDENLVVPRRSGEGEWWTVTPTYNSFDVDGLDPVFAPATGAPPAQCLFMRSSRGIR